MKKIKLKNYFKTGVLFFISLSMWNCQYRDDSITGEIIKEKKIRIISFHDFENAVVQDKSFTSISRYLNTYQRSNKNSKILENSLILTDKIIKAEKIESVSYTFRLLKTASGNEFYNMVIEADRNGNIQRSVIISYLPSNSWLADTSQPFSGYVSVQNNAIFPVDSNTNIQTLEKAPPCYEVSYEWECNAGNEHAPNTCTAGGSDLVITYFEVSCQQSSVGNVSFPVGDSNNSSGPGGGGSGTGNTGPEANITITSPVRPDTIDDDCNIALSLNINCNTLLVFEQDYKDRMSISENQLYESMSRVKQLSYLANAQFAIWKVEEFFPDGKDQYNGKGDAFRHAYWNAANVNDLGYTLTESLTTAHEDKPPSYAYSHKEKQMDLFNNQVGRDRWNWPLDGYNSLEETILDAINSGTLRCLNNLNLMDNSATNLSQLIPTNQ